MLRSSVLLVVLLRVGLAAVLPNYEETQEPQSRIVGGSLVFVNAYPYASPLLYSSDLVIYYQACAGTIISNTAILSAAHCFEGHTPNQWLARVGSSYATTGGLLHRVGVINMHPAYSSATLDSDVAVLRTATIIEYTPIVSNTPIASNRYALPDDAAVTAIGWGRLATGGFPSEQMRAVQLLVVNQATCASRYLELGTTLTSNMVCAGWLDEGGRDACEQDDGGPLIHGANAVVGITSWGYDCADPRYPRVWTKVSAFTDWIVAAAS